MSKNNKYGSLKDLMDALRALHAEGISAIADWVPDQIYNLPGKEVVTASRTNSYGTPRPNAEIYNSLYAAKTRTFGNDFQGKYGGAFLDELKAKYPAIFERVQISNGRKLTTNEKSHNGQPSISMEAISKVQGLAMSCKITQQTNTST